MFTLEGHWGWVWSAYAVGGAAFAALVWSSVARLRAARRRLDGLEAERGSRA